MERIDHPLTPEETTSLCGRVAQSPRRPALAVVCLGVLPRWVGEDCAACGIYCEQYALPLNMGPEDLLDLVEGLNQRPDLDGVLVWAPLPEGGDSIAVSPDKQVFAPTWLETLELTIARAEKRE